MGIFLPNRRAQPRRFSYEPRFYNPEKDEGLKRRMRVGSRATRRRSKSNLLTLLILLAFAVYIYTLAV